MSRGAGVGATGRCPAAILVALALAVASCGPSPRPSMDGNGSAGPTPGLAGALADAIDRPTILADLERLGAIGTEHGDTRQVGGPGYAAAASFVAEELRAAGFSVTLEPVQLPIFTQLGPGLLEIQAPGAPAFAGPVDFKPMVYSPSGDVTAALYALGFDPAARPDDRNGPGCDASSWATVPSGTIVLTQPGHCLNRTLVERAQSAGAVGLVIANPDWEAGRALRPTLLDPAGLDIPAVAVTREVGLSLAAAAEAGRPIHLATSTRVATASSVNVIAETPGGDPAHVVLLGGHLDGVIDGPGIDDNGSGAMAILEIARRLGALTAGRPAWKLRVAFWTGEEVGLRGSVAYADGLADSDRRAIAAYLNFDMLGSRNGVRAVYDGTTATAPGAVVIDDLFGRAFDARGLAWQRIPLPSSDEYRFDQLGVPVGGLFTGAGSRKTVAEAATFGGTAGEPYDPCYHLACDTLDNVDPTRLEEMARAAAWVVGDLASGSASLEASAAD